MIAVTYIFITKVRMNICTVLSFNKLEQLATAGVAFLVEQDCKDNYYEQLAAMVQVDLAVYAKENKFTGAAGSMLMLPVVNAGTITTYFLVGLGKKDEHKLDIETYRRALGTLVTTAQSKKLASLSFVLPCAQKFEVAPAYLAQQTATTLAMAGYRYDTFISVKSDEVAPELIVTVLAEECQEIEHGFKVGQIIGQAVNRERDWVNTPPSRLTPTDIANKASALAQEHGLKVTVFDGKKILEIGMQGLHGVSRGSAQDPRFVILEYTSNKPDAQTIGFVGKGITFDSGGLSIKPANSMEEMKEDMAGAGAVINAIVALAQLRPSVNIVACAAITENLVGPDSLKPGDILKFYNGKTAEVRNTDAEGRLVLADALSYITKNYQLSAVVDIATLTGACIYAVGPFFSALLSDNRSLADKVKVAGQRSGDRVWELPFTQDFKAAISSDIADIQNVGNPSIAAGTITAGWFLREFVENNTPWVHLDIASSAFNVPNISYYRKGATGSSVRLLIDLAMEWKN